MNHNFGECRDEYGLCLECQRRAAGQLVVKLSYDDVKDEINRLLHRLELLREGKETSYEDDTELELCGAIAALSWVIGDQTRSTDAEISQEVADRLRAESDQATRERQQDYTQDRDRNCYDL